MARFSFGLALLLWIEGSSFILAKTPPWPMFHGDPTHRGVSPFRGPTARAIPIGGTPTPIERWSISVDGPVEGSPAVDNQGVVYILSGKGSLYAFPLDPVDTSAGYPSRPTPKPLWVFRSTAPVKNPSPAIGPDGTIYFTADNGFLFAVQPNGQEKWRLLLGSPPLTSPTIAESGTLYIGGLNSLYAVSPEGTLLWKFPSAGTPVIGTITMPPSLDELGTLFFGTDRGSIWAVSPTGNPLWEYQVGSPLRTSPVIDPFGALYIGAENGRLYALSTRGRKLWDYPTAGPILSTPALAPNGLIYFSGISSVAVTQKEGGEIEYTTVYSLFGLRVGPDQSVGAEVNVTLTVTGPPPINTTSSPLISREGNLFFVLANGPLFATNASGALIWALSLGDITHSSPALAEDGTLIIGTSSGRVVALQGSSALLSTPSVTAVPGSSLRLPLNISGLVGDFTLEAVFEIVGPPSAPSLGIGPLSLGPAGKGAVLFPDVSQNRVSVLLSLRNTGGTTVQGALLTIPLTIPNNTPPGTLYQVNFLRANAFEPTGQPFPLETRGGQIVVRSLVPGDVNGDGSVDVLDAVLALNEMLNPGTLTDVQRRSADVHPRTVGAGGIVTVGDGVISLGDVLRLLRRGLGLETGPFP